MISKVLAASAVAATAMAGYSNVTVITTDVTVTDYVTYCPEETTITITKCTQDKCQAEETKVPQGTVTIYGECVIPTVITKQETETVIECVECEEEKKTSHPTTTSELPKVTSHPTTTSELPKKTEAGEPKEPQHTTVTECPECEEKPKPTLAEESRPPVPTYEGAAGKAAVGAFAGVAAVAAALL